MNLVLNATFLTGLLSGSFGYARPSRGIECSAMALKSCHYYAVLNGDAREMKELVIQGVNSEKMELGGKVIVGQRYGLRNPQEDINYCSVFISNENGKCTVYEIAAEGT